MIFERNIAKLAIISFALMFLDMLLIRLIGTEIRIFAYISNLILLTVFLGSGIGMFIKRNLPLGISMGSIAVMTGLLATDFLSGITDAVGPVSDSYIWTFGAPAITRMNVILGILEIFFLLLLIVAIFIPIGQYVANLFKTGRSISFYTVHILFSILGMWFFYGLSGLTISPYIGICLGQCLLLAVIPNKKRIFPAVFAVATFLIVMFIVPTNTIWSPYQKLQITALGKEQAQHKFLITVNNVGFMVLDDLSEQSERESGERARAMSGVPENDTRFLNSYAIPYFIKPSPKDVLIIGAGGGNDAAAAIRAQASTIDAVEIDPEIIRLGNRYHPERPYANRNIRVITDDGRSFLKKTTKKYDVVILAFADSHTTNSSVTNIQLDNYLYTLESYQEIKNILKPDGILFLSFAVPRPWVGRHIQDTLAAAFYQRPLIFTLENDTACIAGCDGTFFISSLSRNALAKDIDRISGLTHFINARRVHYTTEADIVRDDWPYLYLLGRRIPNLHLITSLLLCLILFVLGRNLSMFSRIHTASFLLGMAFLLYEFQNITRTSLLFGNTWAVNVYTVTATLLMSVLANIVYAKFAPAIRYSYAGLFISLLLELLVPLSALNRAGFIARLGISSLVIYIPVFFSGLLFITLFSHAKDKQSFLGSNFIGSFFGGLLSLLSYIFGLHALLYLGIGIYTTLALVSRKR